MALFSKNGSNSVNNRGIRLIIEKYLINGVIRLIFSIEIAMHMSNDLGKFMKSFSLEMRI